jgi:hypothetical protein
MSVPDELRNIRDHLRSGRFGQREVWEQQLEKAAVEVEHMKVQFDPMLQFFSYKHLPERLQAVSMPFCELAENIVDTLPRNPERTTALRKLLEAKDCAVRAELYITEKAE